MIFDMSRYGSQKEDIVLGYDKLEIVSSYKYLGHMLERNLLDTKDVDARLKKFYISFNSTFRKFKNVSVETFLYLFNSYCLPDYGLALWNTGTILNKNIFKVFQIAFHGAMKKIVGTPFSTSNHDVTDKCHQLLLQHYVVFLQCRYFKRILKSKHPLVRICLPFLSEGILKSSLHKILPNTYSIEFRPNDLDIIRARIGWVQRNEVRTGVRFNGIYI